MIKTSLSYKWNTCLLRILLMLISKLGLLMRTILSFFKYQLTTTMGSSDSSISSRESKTYFLLDGHHAIWEYYDSWNI